MSIVLITGGNKGLGYETARRMIELGYRVWIGCRDRQRGITKEIEIAIRIVEKEKTNVTWRSDILPDDLCHAEKRC